MSDLDKTRHAHQTIRSAEYVQSEVRETSTQAWQNSTGNGTESARASIFPLVAGVDLDSYDEYESGAIDQHARCEYGARILMFGAIRRAVSVARYHDQRAKACRDIITKHVTNQRLKQDDYLVDVECAANNAWHHTAIATDIRHAIRTAIGTGKA